MIRLATVVGSRTNILWHFLTYYSNVVDEIYVGVYNWKDKQLTEEVKKIIYEFPKAKIVLEHTDEKYNWETVTSMYNRIKNYWPNDWWIVADDDEFSERPAYQVTEELAFRILGKVLNLFLDNPGYEQVVD